jgi:preprotein translocase subunit YajC
MTAKLMTAKIKDKTMRNALLLTSLMFTAASAHAEPAASAPGAGGGLMQLAPFLVIFVIFYFFLIRPQQKQAKEQKKMIENLKRGDRVLTQGGLYGTVTAVKGKVLELKISGDVKVFVARAAVTEIVPGDPAQEPESAEAIPAKN